MKISDFFHILLILTKYAKLLSDNTKYYSYLNALIINLLIEFLIVLLNSWCQNKTKHNIARREINPHRVIIREI